MTNINLRIKNSPQRDDQKMVKKKCLIHVKKKEINMSWTPLLQPVVKGITSKHQEDANAKLSTLLLKITPVTHLKVALGQ